MLYDTNSLTDEQARQVIGPKMNARIQTLNSWLKENNYCLLLHSTFNSRVTGILSEQGLHHTKHTSFDTRDDILDDCAISEDDLQKLENWIKKNKKGAKINKTYETHPHTSTATLTIKKTITAKDLLEYNHRGGNVTIVFCVPQKGTKKVGRSVDPIRRIGDRFDPYLRRIITGTYQKDGSIEFVSEYFYPREGILFVYDRENNKIRFNSHYDEEYFLDDTTPQKGHVQKGFILNRLRNIDKFMSHNSNGTNR